jgi:hypothetical protein
MGVRADDLECICPPRPRNTAQTRVNAGSRQKKVIHSSAWDVPGAGIETLFFKYSSDAR